jgi:hypothetical protein
VLSCFRSRDPQVSLEPVAQGPDIETEEVARAGVEDVMNSWLCNLSVKLKMRRVPPILLYPLKLLSLVYMLCFSAI